MSTILDKVRVVEDWPKPGIKFLDIMPMIADPYLFNTAVGNLEASIVKNHGYDIHAVDGIVALESRGLIFGAPLSQRLWLPFIPIRKKDKLPPPTVHVDYQLEYGTDWLCMSASPLPKGSKVIIIDDVLATGGTAVAAIKLCREADLNPVGVLTLIEILKLGGAHKVREQDVRFDTVIVT